MPVPLKNGAACFQTAPVWLCRKLFRALINPRADEADLFVGKFLRTLALGHERVRIADVRNRKDEAALSAVADDNDFAFLAALECGFKRFQSHTGARLVGAGLAFQALGFENRLDIGGEGHVLFVGRGWQLGVGGTGGYGETESRREGGQCEFGGIHVGIINLIRVFGR